MRPLKIIFKIFLFTSLLLISSAVATYGQDFPQPFDRIKEVAVTRGQENEKGTFMWEKNIEDVEYWMVYSLSDGSVGCGQRTDSSGYGWGIAYGLKGEFQFLEAINGQIVNFLLIEEESAVVIANQFLKELEAVVGNPLELQTGGEWVKI